MSNKTDWKDIDEYNSLPSVNFIHFDTRDCHVLFVDRGDRTTVTNPLIDSGQELSECIFSKEEILRYLKAILIKTRGKLTLFKDSEGRWIKYIRFVKVLDNTNIIKEKVFYVAYTVIGNNYIGITKELIKDLVK